jgi:hypothetical protein
MQIYRQDGRRYLLAGAGENGPTSTHRSNQLLACRANDVVTSQSSHDMGKHSTMKPVLKTVATDTDAAVAMVDIESHGDPAVEFGLRARLRPFCSWTASH